MNSLRTLFAVALVACSFPISTLHAGDLSVGANWHRASESDRMVAVRSAVATAYYLAAEGSDLEAVAIECLASEEALETIEKVVTERVHQRLAAGKPSEADPFWLITKILTGMKPTTKAAAAPQGPRGRL